MIKESCIAMVKRVNIKNRNSFYIFRIFSFIYMYIEERHIYETKIKSRNKLHQHSHL
jgi:hypothetical protein